MHAARTAQIGTVLVATSVGLAFLWWYSVGYLFLDWYFAYQISTLTFAMLMVSPSIALAIAGFVLYVVGRKKLWNVGGRPKGLFALLGLAFMLIGGFLGVWYWAFAAYAAGKLPPQYDKPLVYYLGTNSPYFILFALWILSGLLMFADAIDALLVKRSTSTKA